jgi:autotransporter-associated beta strand protein
VDHPDVFINNTSSGAGKFVHDRGQPVLLTNNATNTYSGGTDLLGGFTRQVTATGNFGTGPVNVYPGAAVIVNNTSNITGGISKFQSSNASMSVLGINAVGLAAAPTSILPSANITSATGIGGILALDGVTTLAALDMSTLYNGNWYLGSINGGGTYTGNAGTLIPSSGVYRLGGGGGGLTLQPATAGADVLTGANRVDFGVPNARQGFGTVTLGTNISNTYSGGSNIFRGRDTSESFVQGTVAVQGGNMTGGVFRTPLGTGAVQNFGDLQFQGVNGTLVNAAGNNYTSVVTHPGSRLWFDNNTAPNAALTEGRFDDSAALTLNGATLFIRGTSNINTANQKETIGALTVERGADIRLGRQGTGSAAIAASSLTRTGSATLMISNTATLLGVGTGAMGVNNSENVLFTSAPAMTNNMVAPWIVSRGDNQFLKYDATNGLQIITQTTTPANYIAPIAANITLLDAVDLPLNNGTEILSADTGAATLGTGFNPNIWALRTNQNISTATGEQNSITIRSGGLLSFGNITITPDLNFVNSGGTPIEALIYSSSNSLNLNGRITASQVTKFGTAFLNINRDQPTFTGDWVVNGGGLQVLAPNALGSGQVILNGSRLSDSFSYDFTELRYNMDSRQADPYTWQGGKITAYNLNVVRDVFGGANDRIDVIPAIDARTTNAVPGAGQPGTLIVRVDNSRTELRSGALTLFDHYQVHVDANNLSAGSTVTYAPSSINNGGSFDLLKTGDAVLALGDNSATFTGSRRFEVAEGAVRVLHNGAFGAAGTNAVITAGGAMEIAVSNFTPTATLTQTPDSIERWALNDARGTGAFTMGDRVHLQVSTNLTGSRTIDLNGGSLMGYLPVDHDAVAVIHTIGTGVTVNLLKDSFLGQPFPAASNSWMYDMGKLNGMDNLNPSNPSLTGSWLQIDGNITGAFNLTKQGHDIIMLSGAANAFSSLTIRDGQIQTGRTNTLPAASSLTTTADGRLDLFGYDQVITSLNSVGTTVSGVAQADHGRISNSAFQNNKIEVTGSGVYGGNVEGNVTVKKSGSGTLQFTAVNEYRGGTELNGGKLSISQDRNLGAVPMVTGADNLKFDGGTLLTTASFVLPAARGVTLNAGGGTVEVAPTFTTQVDGIIIGAGGLSKTGTGVLQINNAANNYTGVTNVVAGTLQGGAVDAFAPLSRHVVTGDTVSGTLALNTFDQSIGSLTSIGATQANATVSLSSTLTVGLDGTKDAVYAGGITGNSSSIFQVNGNGAVQTLSTVDNSGTTWNTAIANGVLNVAEGAKLGSGTVTLGITSVSGADDLAGLNLQNTAAFANNITVANINTVGSTLITSTVANAAITGTITLNRDIFAGAAPTTQLSMEGAVSGNGRMTVIDGGNLRLTQANTFAPTNGVAGTSGSPMVGGTIVRAGSVLLENNSAAGASAVNLGDLTSSIGAAVDRATFSSILGSGSFNPNGDGVSAVTGGQNAAGTTGFGAFIGVNSTVDGNTYTSGNVGTRLLISGEEANPERNGIYTIVSVTGGTMNLVRADDFETSNQMKYGGQVAVTNGTYAGQTMFQFEEQVIVRNELTQEPIRFRADVVNPNVAALQNVSGLTVANNLIVNATNGTGTTTIGGSAAVTSGTGTFSGTVQLANVVPGTAETKNVRLTSSTSSTTGITLSGVISEVDTTAVTGDTLSITKVGTGTTTLTAVNTFRGTTTVSDGRLQVGNGGASGTGSIVGLGGTVGAVSVTGAGTTLATAPILAGGSGNTIIGGATTIGTASNPGILAPGLTDSSMSNQTMVFSSTSGITVANSSQIQMSITTPTLNSAPWIGSGLNLNDYITGSGTAATFNVAPATYGDLDFINITSGGLSLGSRASGTFGNGSLLIQNNGYATPAVGDVFNIFDWATALTGSFSIPGTLTAGGTAYGDLDLPALTGSLVWDVSALSTHGLIAVTTVVPEPSRALLLALGLAGLLLRRRRRA